jgi:hypothetical protein
MARHDDKPKRVPPQHDGGMSPGPAASNPRPGVHARGLSRAGAWLLPGCAAPSIGFHAHTRAILVTISGAVARCCGVLGETLGVHSSCAQSFDSLF